ncbi:hypothetical protein [Pseudanabaena sp. ABRG5-3]|uniref:hypothetical protein n=1 Tax=Pseudanabaena sp. ABRG5-3 TaxID=685565 RepID=UPI000DC7041C|nr:hypothetical protein [Pseudanabaena sp. ABRG5-3]BBC26576.1 hypothetical protein ABRG53_a002 [Pseudanabaena sp. ABRG5-3]
MRNNIQSKIDSGYTYDELLSEGLASFDDIARYESQYSLYDEDGEPKWKRVKVKQRVKPKIQAIKPKKEPEIDFDF